MSFTRINNAFLDNLHKFSSTETKLLLAIARYTIGANKKSEIMSMERLHKQTGCAINTIQDNMKLMLKEGRNILKMTKEKNSYSYELLKDSGLVFDPSVTNLLAVENAFTPINNTFLESLSIFTSPQVKILLTIARHTIGGHIQSTIIPQSTFKEVAGVEIKVLIKNASILETKGYIKVTKGSKKGNVYEILDKDILPFTKTEEPKQQGFFDDLNSFLWGKN